MKSLSNIQSIVASKNTLSMLLSLSLVCALQALSMQAYADDTQPAKATVRSDQEQSIRKIIRFLDQGVSRGMEAMVNEHIQSFPDDARAYGQRSRLIMRTGSVVHDNLIGYRFNPSADEKAQAALEKALQLDPSNAEEISRLGYLHAVQGRYKKAEKAFAAIGQTSTPPAWLGYNKAILAAGIGEDTKAASLLAPLNEQRPTGTNAHKQWSIYRSAWQLRIELALKNSSTDPVAAIRDGLIRRVSISDFYDAALSSTASDKPIIAILSSSDSGCTYCVSDVEKLNRVGNELGEHYELVYASLEPWNEIEKHRVVASAFKISGLPAHTMLHQKELIQTISGGFKLDKLDTYRDSASKIVNGEYSREQVVEYNVLLQRDIADQLTKALNQKSGFKAAAMAQEGREWTSGVAGSMGTQEEADEAALTQCQKRVKKRGMNVACQPYEVN